jgi:hypothetical protein
MPKLAIPYSQGQQYLEVETKELEAYCQMVRDWPVEKRDAKKVSVDRALQKATARRRDPFATKDKADKLRENVLFWAALNDKSDWNTHKPASGPDRPAGKFKTAAGPADWDQNQGKD